MGTILVYTNITTTTDVVKVEDYLNYSGHDFELDSIYYNHSWRDHSKYDKVYGLIDTSAMLVSDEFKKDILTKVDKLYKKNVKIVLCNLWESENQIKRSECAELLKDYKFDIWHGNTTFFWLMMFKMYNQKQFTFDHSEKHFDFMYLNKAQRPHRDILFDSLTKENHLSNSLFSYHSRRISLDPEYEIERFRDTYPKYGADRDMFEKPYNLSAWNLVSETSINETFITEKVWKPIVAGQPFIVHGEAGVLKVLKQLGFKTFGDYIDESYDDSYDNDTRAKQIVSLCGTLKGNDHLKLYEETQDIRQHNHETFFNEKILSNAVKESVRLLLKL